MSCRGRPAARFVLRLTAQTFDFAEHSRSTNQEDSRLLSYILPEPANFQIVPEIFLLPPVRAAMQHHCGFPTPYRCCLTAQSAARSGCQKSALLSPCAGWSAIPQDSTRPGSCSVLERSGRHALRSRCLLRRNSAPSWKKGLLVTAQTAPGSHAPAR